MQARVTFKGSNKAISYKAKLRLKKLQTVDFILASCQRKISSV